MGRRGWTLREYGPIYVGIVLYLLLDLRCPALYFLKIPCPTCGVTRAIGALLRLDIAGYLQYNWMAPFLVVAVLGYLHRDCLPCRRAITVYTMVVLGLNSVRYLALLCKLFA